MGELQKALQTATTRMLSSATSPGTPPAAAQFAAARGVGQMQEPSRRKAMLGSGGSLFEGLAVGDKPNAGGDRQQNAAALPPGILTSGHSASLTQPPSRSATLPAPPVPAHIGNSTEPGAGSMGGMFSGLDLAAEGSSAETFTPPAVFLNRSQSAASSDSPALEASGVKRGHMSAERRQQSSTTKALSPTGSAAEALADLLSEPRSPQAGMPLCRLCKSNLYALLPREAVNRLSFIDVLSCRSHTCKDVTGARQPGKQQCGPATSALCSHRHCRCRVAQ